MKNRGNRTPLPITDDICTVHKNCFQFIFFQFQADFNFLTFYFLSYPITELNYDRTMYNLLVIQAYPLTFPVAFWTEVTTLSILA